MIWRFRTADRKRLEKQQKYTREQRMAVAPEDDAEGRREIGGKIMSNRGLTPHRSKDTKNPRVRLKNKFAKAVKKKRQGERHESRSDNLRWRRDWR